MDGMGAMGFGGMAGIGHGRRHGGWAADWPERSAAVASACRSKIPPPASPAAATPPCRAKPRRPNLTARPCRNRAASTARGPTRRLRYRLRSGSSIAHDFDSLIELITTTIQPQSWDEVGGPGSIAFFAPTLDFVLTATEEVHEQIDALFDRLRKLPQVSGARRLAARHAAPRRSRRSRLDFDSLIELITVDRSTPRVGTKWAASAALRSTSPERC